LDIKTGVEVLMKIISNTVWRMRDAYPDAHLFLSFETRSREDQNRVATSRVNSISKLPIQMREKLAREADRYFVSLDQSGSSNLKVCNGIFNYIAKKLKILDLAGSRFNLQIKHYWTWRERILDLAGKNTGLGGKKAWDKHRIIKGLRNARMYFFWIRIVSAII